MDNNGSFDVTLKHNESITIKDLPEGTKYVVTETNLPAGFYLNTTGADLTGSIATNETDIVTVVNDYRPDAVPAAISINLTKYIAGDRDWESTDVFKFQLEKMNADGAWEAVGDVQTVTVNDKIVAFKIAENSLTTVGTHYFRVHEVNTDEIPGITNDAAKYFTVVVTEKDGDGKLEIASITSDDKDVTDNDKDNVAISFVNTYTTTGDAVVNIPVEKRMTNGTNVDVSLAGYEFELYEEGSDEPVATVTTNVAGEAIFHLKYTADDFKALVTDKNKVVELNYTLSEKDNDKANVTYDPSKYNVKVTLTSEEGKLKASMTMTKGEDTAATAVFTNTFKIQDNAKASFDFNATKTLEDKALEGNDFTFNMYETGADFVVKGDQEPVKTAKNDVNGNISFSQISYDKAGTYYYVVKEEVPAKTNGVTYDSTEYYVTVTVTYDTTSNKLVASKSIVKPGAGVVTEKDVKFVNDYNVQPTELTLTGTKELTGKNMTNGEFTFVLYDKDGEEVSKATSTSAVANADGVATGTFTFPAIEYTKAGVYEYTIAEKDEGKTGYTYDDTEYAVVVTVTDNGDGTLTAVPEVTNADENGIAFKNSYKPEPASVTFTAYKDLENRTLEDKEFGFIVYEADADFNEGAVVATGSNEADGDVAFDADTATEKIDPITITKAGTYYYVIKEDIPENSDEEFDIDVVYDPIEYHVTVVAYDINGSIHTRITYTANGVPSEDMYFSNVYVEPEPTSLSLDVRKELSGRDLKAGEFTFELYETDETFAVSENSLIETVTNGNAAELDEGTVLFSDLTYDAEDLGDYTSKDFYYVIKEKADQAGGVTYDESVYNIVVTVSNNGDGELEAVVKEIKIKDKDGNIADASKIEFNNTYNAKEATLSLGGTKTLENKNLSEGDFSFALYSTDEDYDIKDLDAKEIVENDANGEFTFGQLTFDEEGTYYYVVAETAGDDAGTEDGKVDYDTTEYQIKVVVTDNGNGEFELDVTYDTDTVLTDKNEAVISNLNFVNGYNPVDAKINLAGTKVLEGRDLIAGEFTFELYETASDYKVAADAEPIQTKVNDENENFTFDTIVYDTLAVGAEETHYYVVKEYAPEEENGITYDVTEYQIKAVVSNDGNGKLSQKVTIDGEEYTDATVVFDALNFENYYDSDLPEGEGLVIKGQKNITGDRTTVAAGEFTFTLAEVTVLNGQEILTELDQTTAGIGGAFSFDVIDTYEEPGTYKYRVTENVGNVEGMTYDATVYDVTVEVVDDGNGNLVIKEPVITVGDNVVKDIEFNNTYDDPTPDTPVQTGDSFNAHLYLLLMLMALTGMGAAVIRRRTN